MADSTKSSLMGGESLARVATAAESFRGRRHPETSHSMRHPFEVDRHRIIASSAFRRLQYKTQVFVYDEHDHFRTRLTHTLEVAEVARRMATGLAVNEALAEAIALAHDVGHAPFGHAGEATLGALMAREGGFEHNVHSLRTVDYLEHPFPEFRGLNLTFDVREGLVKHYSAYDRPDVECAGADARDLMEAGPWPGVEGQIVSMADRLAYNCHDLEDALGAGLFGLNDLCELALWRQVWEPLHERYPQSSVHALRRPVLCGILDVLLADVFESTRLRFSRLRPRSVDDVRHADDPVVVLSAAMENRVIELEAFLLERVYRHDRLARMDERARRYIERLFNAYGGDPALLPSRYARRIDDQGLHRVVCDYIAGMTDRYCIDEHKRLFDSDEFV